jgi:hypothetical protein
MGEGNQFRLQRRLPLPLHVAGYGVQYRFLKLSKPPIRFRPYRERQDRVLNAARK